MSLSVLVSALFIDYYLDFDPCVLCVYQRIPYVIILFASLATFFVDPKHRLNILLLISVAVIGGVGVAIYHTGVEQAWWNPTTRCVPHIILQENTTYDDFMKQVNAAPIGDCSKPAFRILGFSLAEMNVIINLLLLAIVVKLIKLHAKTSI